MPKRDPYRALAQGLENSLGLNLTSKKRHPLHLTGEEWSLIIKALHNTAAPYATRKTTRKPKPDGTTQSKGGTDATG